MSEPDPRRDWRVRLARNPDCPDLPDVERSAAKLFAEFGMEDVANGDITKAEVWEPHCANETIWVAVDGSDHPIGFLASGVQASLLFIYQLAVAREWQRQGIGRVLLECADDYARRHGLEGVALTTFCDVPWNGPYYARLGFKTVADPALPAPIQLIIAAEHERFPEADRRRCAMIRLLARG